MRPFRAIALAGLILLSGVLVLNAQPRSRRGVPAPQPTPADCGPTQPMPPAPSDVRPQCNTAEPTRFQVEFFQVNCPVAHLTRINVEELEAGRVDANELIKRLGEIGEASMVVRVSNRIDLARQSVLTTGSRLPTVQDVNVGANGKVTPSVSYQQVGANVQVQGTWNSDSTAHVRCTIELSSVGQTGIKLASGVQLLEFGQFKIDQQLALDHGQPALLLSNTQATAGYAAEGESPSPAPRCTATLVRITAWRLPNATQPAQ